jgi:ABC-type nitrate/sulfonate/bicarbonate transport system substrate-binding protein
MPFKSIKNRFIRTRSKEITLGFVPLIDCAPLVVAKEMGFFEKKGLKVALQREFGWAAIRDKLLFGELDAAHAAAGLSLSMTLGIGSIANPMLTGLTLNSNGNSIVMSMDLANRLEESNGSFAKRIQSLQGKKKVTLGVVSLTSSHYFLLGEWLAQRGVNIQKDVHIVVLPPPQMTQNMAMGNIQGFCAGEPWGSVAIEEGLGECVAVSSEIRPNHLEKVLLVQAGFEENCHEEHSKIREALLEACEFCDCIGNRHAIAEMISPACYVKCSPELILRSLKGPYQFGNGVTRSVSGFHQFYGESCNAPTVEKSEWLLEQLEYYGLVQGMVVNRHDLLRSIFREDLYRESVGVVRSSPSIDSKTISPSAPGARGVNYQWA